MSSDPSSDRPFDHSSSILTNHYNHKSSSEKMKGKSKDNLLRETRHLKSTSGAKRSLSSPTSASESVTIKSSRRSSTSCLKIWSTTGVLLLIILILLEDHSSRLTSGYKIPYKLKKKLKYGAKLAAGAAIFATKKAWIPLPVPIPIPIP